MHDTANRTVPLRIQFHILRSLSPVADGPILDVVPVQQADRRALVWPGALPKTNLPTEGPFGARVLSGYANSRPVWIEERPMGPLLSDIADMLDRHTLDHIHIGISRGLLALHKTGTSHGNLNPERVMITHDGRVVLLGSGRLPGTIQDDIRAWMSMEDTLASKMGPSLFGLRRYPDGNISEWKSLLENIPTSGFRLKQRQIHAAPELSTVPSSMEVRLETDTTRGSIDEVDFDVGKDAHNNGVLEEWTSGTDEGSLEQTGTLSSDVLNEQRRLALLARLGVSPNEKETPEHIRLLDHTSVAPIQELILNENLDPLPSLGILDLSVNSVMEDISSGEVTRARARPLLTTSEFEEDTAANIENTESFVHKNEVTRVQISPLNTKKQSVTQRIRIQPVVSALGWVVALLALGWLWWNDAF